MKLTMITAPDEPTFTIIHKIEKPNENLDKLEIGPANNRIIIHGDFDNPTQFKARIDNAIAMLKHANDQLITNSPKKE